MESKEVKETNKQTSRKKSKQTTKKVSKILTGRQTVLVNSKLNRH
jgi:hypothetical protein